MKDSRSRRKLAAIIEGSVSRLVRCCFRFWRFMRGERQTRGNKVSISIRDLVDSVNQFYTEEANQLTSGILPESELLLLLREEPPATRPSVQNRPQ